MGRMGAPRGAVRVDVHAPAIATDLVSEIRFAVTAPPEGFGRRQAPSKEQSTCGAWEAHVDGHSKGIPVHKSASGTRPPNLRNLHDCWWEGRLSDPIL